MEKELYKLYAGVHVIMLNKDKEVLLLQRSNTRWASGMYCLPSGFINKGETVFKSACRETKEEVGVNIDRFRLRVSHVIHRKSDDNSEFVDFFIVAKDWKGIPRINEPDKCSQLLWSPMDHLPNVIIPHVEIGLKNSFRNIVFSSLGFDKNQTLR